MAHPELSGVHAESGMADIRAAVSQHGVLGLLDDELDDELEELLELDGLLELDDELLLDDEDDELLDDELLLDDDELLDSEPMHCSHVPKKPSTSAHRAVLRSVVDPESA